MLAGYCSGETYNAGGTPGVTPYTIEEVEPNKSALLSLVTYFPNNRGSPCKIYSNSGSTLIVAYRGSESVND